MTRQVLSSFFKNYRSIARLITLLLVLLCLLQSLSAADTSSGSNTTKVAPSSRIVPPPQTVNGTSYPQMARPTTEGASDMDLGPVQRHFVLAREKDTPEMAANPHIEFQVNPPQYLDNRISFPSIHEVHNDDSFNTGNNEALNFELNYLNWGAVTGLQLRARRGDYMTITWKNKGPKSDFIVRFDYRQIKTKEVIRTLEMPQHDINGTSRAYFAVIGNAYYAYGPISSWRISVLKGDNIVAQTKSFIW